MEALSYYLAYVYRPLVEVLRMKYCPLHYRFFTTYIYHEMPDDVVKRLHRLYFVTDVNVLGQCREEAEFWFWETVKSIDLNNVKDILKSHK
jgi:hypothetical protein